MTFIATCEETFGLGHTLEEAWEDLKSHNDSAYDINDCSFYEAEMLAVEIKVQRIEFPVKKKVGT